MSREGPLCDGPRVHAPQSACPPPARGSSKVGETTSPVTSPAPKMPARASSVAGVHLQQPRSVWAIPVARHASRFGRRPWHSNRSADTTAPDSNGDDGRPWREDAGRKALSIAFRRRHMGPDHQGDAIRLQVAAAALLRPPVLEARNVGPASITVTVSETCEGLPQLDSNSAPAGG